MFHNSTTLHHSHSQFSMIGRESRVVHITKLADWKLKGAIVWDYMRPLRKVGKLYSWAFGWPLIAKGAEYTMKGLGKAVDGVEWAGYTAVEGAKGALEMTAKPPLRLAFSRLVAIKRFLWDVPIAAVSAAIRTPIALAKSPLEMVRGVRDAIGSVPRNAMEIFNSIRQFRLWDTIKNTRKAITDVILPPITRPAKPVLTPVYDLAKTAVHAEGQTLVAARKGIDDVFGGWDRIKNSGATASAKLTQIHEARAILQAADAKEKKEKREALKAAVAREKGEGGGAPAGGAMKKSA